MATCLAYLWGFCEHIPHAVRESANKSVASAASPDYAEFQAVIKSPAFAASLAEAALAADWITSFFSHFLAVLAAQQTVKKVWKIAFLDPFYRDSKQ